MGKKIGIIVGVIGTVFIVLFCLLNLRLIPYMFTIGSCKKQLEEKGVLSGLVKSPSKLLDLENFSTGGCLYHFVYDGNNEVLYFDMLLFDKNGWPHLYRAKIEQMLEKCRIGEKNVLCGRQKIDEYRDFPEGKVVIFGVINDTVPGVTSNRQPDLNLTNELFKAISEGGIYPWGLLNNRLWIWGLVY